MTDPRHIPHDPAEPTEPGVVTPPPHPAAGGHDAPPPVVPARRRPFLSPLNQRRWRNFRRNGRAFWSLIIFTVIFTLSLFAEFIANDKPILVNYRGDYFAPIFNFYPETAFGGDFQTEAVYTDIEVKCLIRSGGREECFDDPEQTITSAMAGSVGGEPVETGWILWPPIPYSYDTINDIGGAAPSAPDGDHLLGTDDTARDVAARVIYGFRLSILFTLIVTVLTSIIGIVAGAVQGFFGGWTDLVFQRVIEIWTSTPSLYIIIILFAILGREAQSEAGGIFLAVYVLEHSRSGVQAMADVVAVEHDTSHAHRMELVIHQVGDRALAAGT